MRNTLLFYCLLLVAWVASGQPAYKPPSGPTPRTASGKVDFSGVWQKPYAPDMTKVGGAGSKPMELPFTDWGLTQWKSYRPEDGDYTGACLPFGLSRSINTPEPMQIVQTEKYFTLLFEQNNWYTVVPIDGRKHREIDSTWFGDSVGHWEGDTLVIDTVNFNGKTRLDMLDIPIATSFTTSRDIPGRTLATSLGKQPSTIQRPTLSLGRTAARLPCVRIGK